MAKAKKEKKSLLNNFNEKVRGAGVKVKEYVTNSDRSVKNTENRTPHSYTDGRSSKGVQTQTNQYGGKGVATSSKNGRMAIEVKQGNSGKTTYDTKNATTNLFSYTDENGVKHQSGTHKGKNGKMTSQGNRRVRDYYVRVGLNNDQRSPEAIQRLRDAGLSDAEIGIGGSGARALTTG